jgi:diguanylate cyclase (GGDEF)-like protein
MPNKALSIIIVDDARFSRALIAKMLRDAGYANLRIAESGREALSLMRDEVADLLITDWLMPEMSGLELSNSIDAWQMGGPHYTYRLIVTGKESPEALDEAFQGQIDDFIFKSALSKELVPRVRAAGRAIAQRNTVLKEQYALQAELAHLTASQMKDPVTGVGTALQAGETLARVLKHTEARGGATSYMLLNIQNWDDITGNYRSKTHDELAQSVAKKIRSLVRPMDEVCRMNAHQFVVIAHFANSENCTASTYKRIHHGLNHQSFQTSAGFISINLSTAICVVEDQASKACLQQLSDFSATLLENETHNSLIVSEWRSQA